MASSLPSFWANPVTFTLWGPEPRAQVFMTKYPAEKRMKFLKAYLVEQSGKLEPEEEAEAKARTSGSTTAPSRSTRARHLRFTPLPLGSLTPGSCPALRQGALRQARLDAGLRAEEARLAGGPGRPTAVLTSGM